MQNNLVKIDNLLSYTHKKKVLNCGIRVHSPQKNTAIFRLQQKRLHLQKQSHLQAYFHQTQLAEDQYTPVQDHADTSLANPTLSRTAQTLSPLLEPSTPCPEMHYVPSDCETMEAQQGVLVK